MLLLGFVILGPVWKDDEDLRKVYESYEAWIKSMENCGQMVKWCVVLRESNFAKTTENRAKYIEIYKFIFRDVFFLFRIQKDLWRIRLLSLVLE